MKLPYNKENPQPISIFSSRYKISNAVHVKDECISIQLSVNDPRYRKKVEVAEPEKMQRQEDGVYTSVTKLRKTLNSLLTDYENLADEIYIYFANFSYIIDLAFEQLRQKVQKQMRKLTRKQQRTQKYYLTKFENVEKQAKLSKKKYEQQIKELENEITFLKGQLALDETNKLTNRKQTKEMENTQDSNEITQKNEKIIIKEQQCSHQSCSWKNQKILARDRMWNEKMESINSIKMMIAKIKGKIHDRKTGDIGKYC